MRVNIYLDNFNIKDFSVDKCFMNPILFTNNSREYFEKSYFSSSYRIVQAVKNNTPLVHIKNTEKKSYKVPTPYCGKVQSTIPKDLLYRMFSLIGTIGTYPISYIDENESIIRVVAPRIDSHNEFSSQSPFTDLDWHVDAAYRPMFNNNILSPMPDYLVFGVVHQGHEKLPITYVALKDVIDKLSDDDLSIGLSSEFNVLSADSFANKTISKNIPLLHKESDNSFSSRITLQNAIPQTQRAEYFLQKIRSILDQSGIQNTVKVDDGDIVILNNKITLHKRDSYIPKWDGRDRYFVRIYSVKDLTQGILDNHNKPWQWK